MKPLCRYLSGLALLCALCTHVNAQSDTLFRPVDKVRDQARALSGNMNLKIDSLKDLAHPSSITDTTRYYRQKADSISQRLNHHVDSLRHGYTSALGRINAHQAQLQSRLDSLAERSLPVDNITSKMDSLQQQLTTLQTNLRNQVTTLKDKALQQVNGIKFPPGMEGEIKGIESKIAGIVPDLAIASTLPDVSGMAGLSHAIPAIPALSTPGLPARLDMGANLTGLPPDVPSPAALSIPSADQLTNAPEVTGAMKDATGIAGEVSTMQHQPIDELADKKLSGISGVSDIRERSQIEGSGALRSEEALKAELTRQARTVALDHFSDKQQQLKSAMEKLSKYKTKYGEMTGIADLNKKPENPLKKKQWYERITPGVNLQVQKKGADIIVDLNPCLGYQFAKRIAAGAGWNERIGYNWDQKAFRSVARIFGPRIFGEYLLGKGFSPRLEFEVMNTLVPPATVKHGDPDERLWVPGAFAGIKKQYRIAGQLKGTATVMFRLFDPQRQSPYGDAINARFGFEYAIRKGSRSSGAGSGK